MQEKEGILYIIATPIGNLEDISARAVRMLGEVNVVLCEDTRTTGKLLKHYNIDVKTISYHAHSNDNREDYILDMLREGKSLALVSDAGTPTISDPGVKLVERIKRELSDVMVSPIPGPSALMSALSVSGISSAQFVFLGFLPHKKGRETLFQEILESNRTMVFYESTHRIMKTLERLQEMMPNRHMAVARELTKIYEQVKTGSFADVYQYFIDNPDKVRGEFVVIVAPYHVT
jgi:16S rRNA (cytidine1402-2'-O)-methyltransferase